MSSLADFNVYWWHRLVLQPLGFSSQVNLGYNAEEPRFVNGQSLADILKKQCPSLAGPKAWYTPSGWMLQSGSFQTAYQALGNYTKVFKIEYERKFIRVPDGGTLCLDITPPLHKEPADTRPILICLHGLTGGSHESYVRAMLSNLTKPKAKGGHGWRGIVFNYRGCANSPLSSAKFYHAGATYDIKSAMLYVSSLFPDAPIYGVGFSLGAVNLTKYLGVEAAETPMKSGVVLGTPWNLMKCHTELQSSLLGLFFSKAMGRNLRTLMLRHKDMLSNNPGIDIEAVLSNPNMTLYEVDTVVTSKGNGYSSAEDYYRSESPDSYVGSIDVPLLSINSLDDPIASAKAIPFESCDKNPSLVFATTKHGGHLAWFTGAFSFRTKTRWVVKPVTEWLVAMHEADPAPKRNGGLLKQRKPVLGEMVLHATDPNCGFMEVGEAEFTGGDDEKILFMAGL